MGNVACIVRMRNSYKIPVERMSGILQHGYVELEKSMKRGLTLTLLTWKIW